MTSSGTNGLKIITNACPKWDRKRSLLASRTCCKSPMEHKKLKYQQEIRAEDSLSHCYMYINVRMAMPIAKPEMVTSTSSGPITAGISCMNHINTYSTIHSLTIWRKYDVIILSRRFNVTLVICTFRILNLNQLSLVKQSIGKRRSLLDQNMMQPKPK